MAEIEPSENSNGKRIRQSISVPFLWEEKPGTPKRDWKPSTQIVCTQKVNPVATLPVKLVASIPFEWEEKPGTPLPCFSQAPPEGGIQLPPEELTERAYRIFESAIDGCGFETEESFHSAPSAPTNCVESTVPVSNAVSILETSWAGNNGGEPQSPSSTDSESGYATETKSLVGEAFLECLFPLLSTPHSGFLEKHGRTEKTSSNIPRKVQSKDFDRESNCSVAVRRTITLGDLLMMSHRRSYRRRAVQMPGQNLSTEYMKIGAIERCIFSIDNWIEELQRKWKRQLRLKLM
ncbi:hypothetical protein Vadar_001284 [Vaccinium darrowii]|uniref:Uncharacterized protein n=1 Tax=Vaccinium darrowii TaxID=229202 RepID=A0ACB7YIF5_9ERIC|nr:hypothetical protein Vadar_001284 [Vaccinium darrowii]